MRRLLGLVVLVAVPSVVPFAVQSPVSTRATFEECYELEVTIPPYNPEASICPPIGGFLPEAYARPEA